MKNSRIRRLFEAARAEPTVEPPADFAGRVARAIQRDSRALEPVSVFDMLASLFPRLAWAAALVIGLCLAVEFYFSANSSTNLSMNLAVVAEQWLFTAN